MKKTLKTIDIVAATNVLAAKETKMTQMSATDKSALFRTYRNAKPFLEAFAKFKEEVPEKMQPDNFEEMRAQAEKFKSLSDEEKIALNKAFAEYKDSVDRCIADEGASEKEIEIFPLSEEGFEKFMESNSEMSLDDLSLVEVLMQE